MNGSLASSVTGWNSWLTNALIMEKLSEDELKELASKFQEIALSFLELDIKYTKMIEAKNAESRAKEKIPASKQHRDYSV